MLIGICDDSEFDQKRIKELCEKISNEIVEIFEYRYFQDGTEVLEFCQNQEQPVIDLLFLDVEMPVMNGIDVKNQVVRNNKIFRIAFVSSHIESMAEAFSLKTIGFIHKPCEFEQVKHMIEITVEDLKDNIQFEFLDFQGDIIKIKLEDILYFEAEGSYTHMICSENHKDNYVISKKIGQIDKQLKEYGFIRVHKSYLVNLANMIGVSEVVQIRKLDIRIPLGRKYKEETRKKFLLYGREVARKRI